MPRFRLVLVFGLAGALVGVVPDGVSAAAARARCRATAGGSLFTGAARCIGQDVAREGAS
jgi:hypothetical protein